jgi:competence protein ComEC
MPAARGLLIGTGLAVGGMLTAALAARAGRRLRRRVVAAVLFCAAAGAFAAGWRVAAVHRGPLPLLAQAHAHVALVFVITSDPHLSAASAQGGSARPLVVMSARAVEVAAAGHTTAIRSPVVVLATGGGWLSLQPTQRVRAVGRVSLPNKGELIAAVFDVSGSPTLVGGPSVVQRLAGRVRAGLRVAAAPLPSGPRGLLPGLVDGDTSGLPPGLAADFRTTGLTHIVAVSGANVAIMLGVALAMARCAGARIRAQALTGALTVVAFVVVARPQASVLRAAAMGLVAVLALATGRRRRALPALCAAVLCLIYLDPTLSRSVGFALSVSATAALLLLAPVLRDRMARRLPLWLAEALAVPTAATVVCAPLIASISGRVSLSSIPANLLAEPAVAPATILGVATACVAPFSMTVARVLAHVAGLPCAWLAFVARTFSKAPAAAVVWPSGAVGAFELLGLFVIAVALAAWVRIRRRSRLVRRAHQSRWRAVGVRVVVVASVVSASGLVVAERSPPHWPPTDWVLATCDVGAGSAVVARTGPQAAMLIDTGPRPQVIDACLRALDVQSLPLIVLTRGSSSSVGGLPGALHARGAAVIDVVADLDVDASARVQGWATADHLAVSTVGRVQLNAAGEVQWQVVDDTGTNQAVALTLLGVRAVIVADQSSPAIEQLRPDVLIAAHAGVEPPGGYRPAVVIDATNDGSTALSIAGARLRTARLGRRAQR